MGDACNRCNGTGKIGSKESGGSGVTRTCWACGGSGMTKAGPQGRRK